MALCHAPHFPHVFAQLTASLAANICSLQYLATLAQGWFITPELLLSAHAPEAAPRRVGLLDLPGSSTAFKSA